VSLLGLLRPSLFTLFLRHEIWGEAFHRSCGLAEATYDVNTQLALQLSNRWQTNRKCCQSQKYGFNTKCLWAWLLARYWAERQWLKSMEKGSGRRLRQIHCWPMRLRLLKREQLIAAIKARRVCMQSRYEYPKALLSALLTSPHLSRFFLQINFCTDERIVVCGP